MQNEDAEYGRDFTKQIQTQGVSMKRFLASTLMIAFVGVAFAMEGHENHNSGKISCGMGEKTMCSARDFSQKQVAGSYTVGIHAMGNTTMLCILDSAAKPVSVKSLSVSQAGKEIKTKSTSCGYTLPKGLDLSKGELKISFTAGGKLIRTIVCQSANSSAPVNTECPVMGGKVDPKYTVTHEGRVIAFCCPGCIPEFKKDPAKYMSKLK